MPVRCPKCTFESPDDAAWCDFCKEPFRKVSKKEEPAAQPVPAPPAPVAMKTVEAPVPEDAAATLEALRKADAVLKSGDVEKLPTLPPWFRGLAWLFLGVWLMTGIMLAGMMFARRREARQPTSTSVETMSLVETTP